MATLLSNTLTVSRKPTENYLRLPDGRQHCYAEYGDPRGWPLVLVHGNPNSRLLWAAIPGSPFLPHVHLWQGEEDVSIALAVGRYLAEHIPDCDATFIPGAGHFWLFEHLAEMLEKLVPAQPRSLLGAARPRAQVD